MRQFVTTAASSEAPIQQKEMIADYFNHLSENVDATDTTSESFDKLNNCMVTLRNSQLPTTREEFEVRANLFYLIFEIENYLRSEEHTSELQSRGQLVCRLLLEKKK